MLWQPSLPESYTRASPDELAERISARRRELGDRLVILGHHYQTDDVIRHADFTGDSLKLSQLAAQKVAERGAEYVVFCGVHFMAETADLLTPDHVSVILPDLSAGCSMADMADYDDAVAAWDLFHNTLTKRPARSARQAGPKADSRPSRIIPITYINSTAAIKAFVGRNGGIVCTSSNAARMFEWALKGGTQPAVRGEKIKILFLPDQHLGRNTAATFGIDTGTETCLYDPRLAARGEALGGTTPEQLDASRVILWAGHCSVHKLFRPEHVDQIRDAERHLPPSQRTTVLVHPECAKEVVDRADLSGSTEYIIRCIEAAVAGSKWAIGTEVHLVNRLTRAAAARGVHVRILSDCQCLCTTMYRIDQEHLCWALDNLAQGKVVNRVRVHPEARTHALQAIQRMLDLSAPVGAAPPPVKASGRRVPTHAATGTLTD
ncbi:MAG: quinolinate synthase NadA [Phycisphaeraceae bacterium]|nr:quinolinate synthase NadA [Phycisphaeraceae bacterium]